MSIIRGPSTWSRRTLKITSFTLALVSAACGIIIVCRSYSASSIHQCQLKFTATAKNPIEYNTRPTSIAAGYFNNDSWLDIVVANRNTDSIQISFGGANGTFDCRRTYSTGPGSNPSSIAVGDLNEDHHLDIVVANDGTHTLTLFFGAGDGSFPLHRSISTNLSRPQWIGIDYFDDDHHRDIAIANYGTEDVTILHGRGDGHFSHPTKLSAGDDSHPSMVVAADVNNDHRTDLIVVNAGMNCIGVFLRQNDGTFGDQRLFSTGKGSRPRSIAVGHFDDDMHLDVAVANTGTKQVAIFLGSGNESFSLLVRYRVAPSSPHALVTIDFDADGILDLVFSSVGVQNVGFFLGYGNGSFAPPQRYSTGSSSSVAIVAGDFNNDKQLDVAIVNNDTNSIQLRLGSKRFFRTQREYQTGDSPVAVAVGDLDGDKKLDIVVANRFSNTISIFLTHRNGTFPHIIVRPSMAEPCALALADMNGDRYLDIIVANCATDSITIMFWRSNHSPTEYTHETGKMPTALAIADLNNDEYPDIVVANFWGSDINIFFGQRGGRTFDRRTYPTDFAPLSIAVGNFNGDRYPDIVIAYQDNHAISILFGGENGTFSAQITYQTELKPGSIAVADLNNDSCVDIVVANRGSGSVSVFLGSGNGTFTDQITYRTGASPMSLTLADLNSDTFMDIIVANPESDTVGVMLGFGEGTFARPISFPTRSAPVSLAVAHFNNDTKPDLIVANFASNTVSVFLQEPAVSLGSGIAFANNGGSNLRSLVARDLNRDNMADLVVANYGTENIGILLGNGDGGFKEAVMYAIGFHPNAVAVNDFDGDTHLDIAILNEEGGNVSLLLGDGNGRFTLQRSLGDHFLMQPSLFISTNWNNDQQAEITVVDSAIDQVVIFTVRDVGAFAYERLAFTDSGPRALIVADLNNDTYLDIVVANYWSDTIGIFFGNKNGVFSNQTTYSTGWRPISLDVTDLNNDHHLDIIVANHASNDINIFFGRGDGTFDKNLTLSSGNARTCSVVALDWNGDGYMDIIVAHEDSDSVVLLLAPWRVEFTVQMLSVEWFGRTSLVVADLDNDGSLDIIRYDPYNGVFDILPCNAHSLSQAVWTSQPVAVADMDDDGYPDLVTVLYWSGGIAIRFGRGNRTFSDPEFYQVGAGPIAVSIGDLNNDSVLDIAVAHQQGNNIGILLGYVRGYFSEPTFYSTGFRPWNLIVRDLNNDHRPDILVANLWDDSLGLLSNHRDFAFFAITGVSIDDDIVPTVTALADFDNDNHTDLVLVYKQNSTVGVILGSSDYPFSAPLRPYPTNVTSSASSMAAADVNQDGQMDVILAYPELDQLMIVFGDGQGSFTHHSLLSTGTGTHPSHVIAHDLNNDTFVDLIVTNRDRHNIGIFLSGRGTLLTVQLPYGSLPFVVLVEDVNQDHLPDLIVGNQGTDSVKALMQGCQVAMK